ncbi:hypothetical protein RHSIM_Rhsim08G0183600 [Rhododendron simsii]|uniref:1,3-beta-glucan synthase n=1 Tax=Rhododendron simsii TaxID=118357 RepID=A0A834LJ29_RHOSS|nr:hypothetical protein RHSIM_Rhsim08G0183600 [Rhododendron simsii]
MARPSEKNWERLVRATLQREKRRQDGRGGHERVPSGIAGSVPLSLTRETNIDLILQAADEIQSEDPNVARILCEQAYTMAQNLDPNSDGRGVLQFKTGLMSVIKQKLAKRDGAKIDRNRDVELLWDFYQLYKRRHRVDDMQREEQKLRESGPSRANLGEYGFPIKYNLAMEPYRFNIVLTGMNTVIVLTSPQATGISVLIMEFVFGLAAAFCSLYRLSTFQSPSGGCTPNTGSPGLKTLLELRSSEMKKVFATLRALVEVMEALSKDAAPDVGRLILEEVRKIKKSDAPLAGELTPYNIVPLEAPSLTNAIGFFPEVRGAISALRYSEHFRFPAGFELPALRDVDMFDLLEFVFGFQILDESGGCMDKVGVAGLLLTSSGPIGRDCKDILPVRDLFEKSINILANMVIFGGRSVVKDNVRNQRENVVLTVANAQSRLGVPGEADPKIDEKAITEVFLKVLDNYIKWCKYLRIRLVWNSLEAINRERKLFLLSLYFLVWGEAANVRFLPECICYIFHNMAKELDAVLDRGEATRAENGSVSFLEEIISPIYKTLEAEAAKNDNGKASHSAWRNYDDFNEYFWSRACFDLGWPLKGDSSFLRKPIKWKRVGSSNCPCGLSSSTGKSSFVEHRTFLHLYRSFHRLWIFLVVMFQALTIIAFHGGKLNLETVKIVLSIGPTYTIMNLIESILDVLLTFGAYSTARAMAISRIVIRFFWFGLSSAFVVYLYVKVLGERNQGFSQSTYFRIYILVLGAYAGLRIIFATLLKFPACHRLSEISDQSFFQFFKWIYQERYFVGRGLYERTTDYLRKLIVQGSKWKKKDSRFAVKQLAVVLARCCLVALLPPWLTSTFVLCSVGLLPLVRGSSAVIGSASHPVGKVCALLVGDLCMQIYVCLFPPGKQQFLNLIKPLVDPTRIIVHLPSLKYSWHDFISENNNNFLTVASFWAPVVAIYLMDILIWHTLLSAIVGGVMGARARLGEIRSLEMVHKRFESFPEAFAKKLVSEQTKRFMTIVLCSYRRPFNVQSSQVSQDSNKINAAMFSPFWNEIIKSLREEDFISTREKDLLSMPSNSGTLRLVQWPLFLLSSKILLAVDLALDCKDTQADLWNRICRDEYMAYAVQECFYSVERILHSLVDGEGRLWVERIFREINSSILEGSLVITLVLKKLPLVLSRFTALTGLLIVYLSCCWICPVIVSAMRGVSLRYCPAEDSLSVSSSINLLTVATRNETPELARGAAKAVYDLYEVVTHDLLSSDLREQLDTWNILLRARNEGRLFSRIEWPNDPEIKEQVKRLHLLLTVKDSAVNIPKNLEARRRLEFFTNSLFMDMPTAKPVSEMMPFCVFTPYYSETVLYSSSELRVENEDGISTLFYLQKIYPDEWDNFLERIGRGDSGDAELQENSRDSLELRFWASYRGQTLARTVRGMMYYRRALMLQSFLENRSLGEGYSQSNFLTTEGFELSREARAQADIKFTYVVSCQIYGQQKQRKAPEAADIALLLQSYIFDLVFQWGLEGQLASGSMALGMEAMRLPGAQASHLKCMSLKFMKGAQFQRSDGPKPYLSVNEKSKASEIGERLESSSRREESFHRRLHQRLVGEWSRLGLRSRPWCISVGERVREDLIAADYPSRGPGIFKNEALRVAFIHAEEIAAANGTISKEFYSKLVKADINGKDQEIFSIKLPGDPKLGEGKPENQNHAIIFTRGEAVQTIDMNQVTLVLESASLVPKNFLQKSMLYASSIMAIYVSVQNLAHIVMASVSQNLWGSKSATAAVGGDDARSPSDLVLGPRLGPRLGTPDGLAAFHIPGVSFSGRFHSMVLLLPCLYGGLERACIAVSALVAGGVCSSIALVPMCRCWWVAGCLPRRQLTDNYLEEAMKMRNLLEEFHANHGIRPPTILGVREHVFTGSVSSLAWFMSNQETSFVTLGQRVLANPLKVRMHYGHPDVFDRIFHISRGGISKASRVINISEDIYAGFNSTLRQGNITHHEYIQVGKGRDVGLNQIALFEGKVAGGNGEQVLSRDIYRLGQLFDFFRMLSFFFTTVGFYVCTMVPNPFLFYDSAYSIYFLIRKGLPGDQVDAMLIYWIIRFLAELLELEISKLHQYTGVRGRGFIKAFSGVDRGIARVAASLGNTSLNAALNAQFLVQIGVFTAVPMVVGFILELGLLKAVFSFITMQLQLCSVFFTFSLGTRTHYFGRTILHGGAKYRATGRGFVVRHIKFADNYRLYSRSHFVKALEVALLLVCYIAYGYTKGGAVSYVLVTLSSWFLVISWLFAPYIFNPSGFEWQKTVEDFDDWTNWLLYKGGVGVKGEHSWESWWDEEQVHIQTLRGRILETILSLRFLVFQYGIVYKLQLTGKDTSLAIIVVSASIPVDMQSFSKNISLVVQIYGFSWVVLVGIVMIFKIFTFSPKKSTNFQLMIRFIQGVTSLGLVAALGLVVAFTNLSIADLFASILAFIPTGWTILCLAVTWKGIVKKLGLWDSVREFARMYDAGMGVLIFMPIAVLSWFPFVSTFQSRLLFNQAFSRGLEISLILAGNKANVES